MKFKTCVVLVMSIVSVNCVAAGNPVAGKAKSNVCAACHGADGNSTNPAWPKLAGQHPEYLAKQLYDYREGRRENPQMSPMAQNLSDEDIADLSAYYASQKNSGGQAKPELLETGEKMYRAGNIDVGVPACAACHGPYGRGNPPAKYPALAGQHATYIEAQLNAFREDSRANDLNKVMRNVVDRMSDEEIKAVSNYIQGLH